jgi:hypothetical protein
MATWYPVMVSYPSLKDGFMGRTRWRKQEDQEQWITEDQYVHEQKRLTIKLDCCKQGIVELLKRIKEGEVNKTIDTEGSTLVWAINEVLFPPLRIEDGFDTELGIRHYYDERDYNGEYYDDYDYDFDNDDYESKELKEAEHKRQEAKLKKEAERRARQTLTYFRDRVQEMVYMITFTLQDLFYPSTTPIRFPSGNVRYVGLATGVQSVRRDWELTLDRDRYKTTDEWPYLTHSIEKLYESQCLEQKGAPINLPKPIIHLILDYVNPDLVIYVDCIGHQCLSRSIPELTTTLATTSISPFASRWSEKVKQRVEAIVAGRLILRKLKELFSNYVETKELLTHHFSESWNADSTSQPHSRLRQNLEDVIRNYEQFHNVPEFDPTSLEDLEDIENQYDEIYLNVRKS